MNLKRSGKRAFVSGCIAGHCRYWIYDRESTYLHRFIVNGCASTAVDEAVNGLKAEAGLVVKGGLGSARAAVDLSEASLKPAS